MINSTDIIKIAKTNPDGFTVDTNGKAYSGYGYAVALRPLGALPPQTKYIGGWASNGVYYIDEVEVVKSLGHAIRLGREHNQQAIWDFNHNQEIRLDQEFWFDVLDSESSLELEESNNYISRVAYRLYESEGSSAVFRYAELIGLKEYKFCFGCELKCPNIDNTCLVCGSITDELDSLKTKKEIVVELLTTDLSLDEIALEADTTVKYVRQIEREL